MLVNTAEMLTFCDMKALIVSLGVLVVLAQAGHAAMSGADFEAYTEGRTLYFGSNGQDYGAEDYLPDRQVRWSFLDGECKKGFWYEQSGSSGPEICFVYEDRPNDPQCWTFERTGGGLRATFRGESGTVLYEARRSEEPQLCLGPDVGV